MTRLQIPARFAHFGIDTEPDPAHPETAMRIDIPNEMVYINTAARADANVIRVRFSETQPERRRWW